ncbi:uncharacterized protein [Haliotis cracherodii]|uniref:uncharacterized protein n=1 Tax=Haliotis cracherodii TaxID=6455 RepID=UPI0039EBB45D
MGDWALKLLSHIFILSIGSSTVISSTTGSFTSTRTTTAIPSAPATYEKELSACPEGDRIPVVGMCRGDIKEGTSMYLDYTLHSELFVGCSCSLRIVNATSSSIEIYSTQIDQKNCQAQISIDVLKYSLRGCQSTPSSVTSNMTSSQALKLNITGQGVAQFCLNIKTKDKATTLRLDCSSGVSAGVNITTTVTKPTASSKTTIITTSSPSTSSTSIRLTSPPIYSTSTTTPSSSTKAQTRTTLSETEPVVTSTTPSTGSTTTSTNTTTASGITSLSSTTSPDTATSVFVTTEEMSQRPSTAKFVSLSPPSALETTVPSLITLGPAVAKSTPAADNDANPDNKSPDIRFPVVELAVGLSAGVIVILVLTVIVLCCRCRHQKGDDDDCDEEGIKSIAASLVSPEGSIPHIQVLNPVYCECPELMSLPHWEPGPQDNVSNASSFLSEEPDNDMQPSVSDADPELDQDQVEMMYTLVTKPSRDCSKRMSYCSPGGRKGSTQTLYRL